MEAQLVMIVGEGGVELVRSVDAAAIDHHHDLFPGFPEGGHPLMDVLAQLVGIEVGHDFREHLRGAILARADHAEPHAAGNAVPGALAYPRLAFAGLLTSALTLAQRTCQEARRLGSTPPAGTGQGAAPEDGCIFIEHNDLATARLVCESGECERAIGEISRGGIQSAGGAVEAHRVFFNTPRTLSRPSWTRVARAKTVASARQLPWEEREPCSRGS
jgi:hypothetical protein